MGATPPAGGPGSACRALVRAGLNGIRHEERDHADRSRHLEEEGLGDLLGDP